MVVLLCIWVEFSPGGCRSFLFLGYRPKRNIVWFARARVLYLFQTFEIL